MLFLADMCQYCSYFFSFEIWLQGLHTFIAEIEFDGLTGQCKRGYGQAQGDKACRAHDGRNLFLTVGEFVQSTKVEKRNTVVLVFVEGLYVLSCCKVKIDRNRTASTVSQKDQWDSFLGCKFVAELMETQKKMNGRY